MTGGDLNHPIEEDDNEHIEFTKGDNPRGNEDRFSDMEEEAIEIEDYHHHK